MGRRAKKKEVQAAGAPLWMITYSDMVTLLLTFFVMLVAMANFDEVGRIEAVLQSIRLALGVGGHNVNIQGLQEDPAHLPKEIQPHDELQPVMSTIREAMSKHVSDDLVKMTRTRTEIRVQLNDSILFKPGSETLHPAAYSLLTDIARILGDYPVQIQVEGHTDTTGSPARNWELSAGRAVSIVNVLQSRGGLDGDKLSATGYGPHRPIALEGTGPSWNRRVELVIQSTSPIAYEALNQLDEVTGGFDGR